MESLTPDQRHELRGPLTAIRGYSELLLGTDGMTEEQKSMIEKINNSVDKLKTLIDTE